MSRLSSAPQALLFALLLVLLMTVACSHEPLIESLDDPAPDNSQLPFERSPNPKGIPPTSAIRYLGIPAGTPLAIRLQAALSSEAAHSGDSFQAFLDEPIIIQGQTVVPRGASVSGRIVAARPSDGLQHPGYLRLTLSAILIDDKSQAVQTTSRFVKGGPPKRTDSPPRALIQNVSGAELPTDPVAQEAQVPEGERFIFRLKETVPGPMDRLPSQLPVTPALNSRTEHP
ncbi:MAG TPA: hypothetical protein VJQ82_11450 [Terriglobales bacterium]|nr:hypothetical protein [Terriglobales bacterium]